MPAEKTDFMCMPVTLYLANPLTETEITTLVDAVRMSVNHHFSRTEAEPFKYWASTVQMQTASGTRWFAAVSSRKHIDVAEAANKAASEACIELALKMGGRLKFTHTSYRPEDN